MAKVKVNQLNQPEHSSPLANGKPKTADSTVSNRFCVCFTHRFCGMNVTARDDHAHTHLAHYALLLVLRLASIRFDLITDRSLL
jgi:hypothetical protein